jgi:hypothetical protein
LAHHGPIGGTDRGDYESVLTGRFRDDLQEGLELAWWDVVEVGISSVEQGRDSSGFEVRDDHAILFHGYEVIICPREGGDRDDRGAKEVRRDRISEHGESMGKGRPLSNGQIS